MDHIDSEGFRANVGMVVSDARRCVLIGGRVGQAGWQFPQGGIQTGETPEEAMFRELHEETGLLPADVQVLGSTRSWVRYRLPEQFVRRNARPLCIGQKQRWYLLRLVCPEAQLCTATDEPPEFDRWRWVDYWQPVREVIFFKRRVYARALAELGEVLFPGGPPPHPDWWQAEWDVASDEPVSG